MIRLVSSQRGDTAVAIIHISFLMILLTLALLGAGLAQAAMAYRSVARATTIAVRTAARNIDRESWVQNQQLILDEDETEMVFLQYLTRNLKVNGDRSIPDGHPYLGSGQVQYTFQIGAQNTIEATVTAPAHFAGFDYTLSFTARAQPLCVNPGDPREVPEGCAY